MIVPRAALSDNRVDQALWALGPGGTGPSPARAKWEGEGLKLDRTSPWSYKGRYNQQSKSFTNESRMGDNINIYNVAMDGRLINVLLSPPPPLLSSGYPGFILFGLQRFHILVYRRRHLKSTFVNFLLSPLIRPAVQAQKNRSHFLSDCLAFLLYNTP
jgi:hypothetical protein